MTIINAIRVLNELHKREHEVFPIVEIFHDYNNLKLDNIPLLIGINSFIKLQKYSFM